MAKATITPAMVKFIKEKMAEEKMEMAEEKMKMKMMKRMGRGRMMMEED